MQPALLEPDLLRVFVAVAEDGSPDPVVCLVSGANRVDLARLAAVTGKPDIRRATAREASELTGFSIGGSALRAPNA